MQFLKTSSLVLVLLLSSCNWFKANQALQNTKSKEVSRSVDADSRNYFFNQERMLIITDIDNFTNSSKIYFDFEEFIDSKESNTKETETKYCVNFKIFNSTTFQIADSTDLLEVEDFECAEGDWKLYSDLVRTAQVFQGTDGIVNVLAKSPAGTYQVYDRLYLKWLMILAEPNMTCTEFIDFLLGGVWFALTSDIDCTGVAFLSISEELREQMLIIGNGHKVSNINIQASPNCWNVGLIGKVTNNSYISNLGIEGISIDATCISGGFFGAMEDSVLENVYIVDGIMNLCYESGGLVGQMHHSVVRNSYLNAEINGDNQLGGIVGSVYEDSLIVDSVAAVDISSEVSSIGGLVGYLKDSEVLRSKASGIVEGGYNVGGLVGKIVNSVISYCSSSGTVHGTLYNNYEGDGVGGLIGAALASSVTYSSSSATVTGDYGVYNVGGLIGYANEYSTIDHCSASGDVTSAFQYVGGLIGYLANEAYDEQTYNLSDSHATGAVTGFAVVGGLVGRADATIVEKVYARGAVTANYTNSAGYAGGLIGTFFDGKLYDSYAIGDVEACTLSTTPCDRAGGLVGSFAGSSFDTKIENSYSLGDVIGTNRTGIIVGSLEDSSVVTNVYSTGTVTGSGQYVGGAFGYKDPTVTVENVYLLSPNTSSSGVTVLTEEEFGEASSFIGFDFASDWEMQNHMMCGDIRRPHLEFEPNYNLQRACAIMDNTTLK